MDNARLDFRRFSGDPSGSVTIAFALVISIAIGCVGMAIDYGRALEVKTRLQRAVDSASLAGASLPATANANRMAVAQRFFGPNLKGTALAKVTTVITANNSGVSVTAAYDYPTLMMQLLRVKSLNILAHASASSQVQNGGVACMLALNPTSSDALHIQGVNKISSNNCWSWVNSTNPQSITAVGAALASAQGFCTTGGVVGGEHFTPTPFEGCDPLPDPFGGRTAPSPQACTETDLVLSNGTFSLYPGTYCGGIVLKPKAIVTFNPGVYVIKDGIFEIQGQSSATGDGVVFVFSGAGAQFALRGGGSASFRAPAAGATNVAGLEGFVFFQDRSTTPAGRSIVIQGGGSVKFEGLLYMPTWQVNIGGNGDMNQESRYFAMVADSFYMEGNGKLYVKADATGADLPDLMPKIKSGPLMLD
jgi:hypothetical protein